MKTTLINVIFQFLTIAMMIVPVQSGHAGTVGTNPVNSAATVQIERNVVVGHLTRAETVNQFQTLGLDAEAARDRVAAMTDEEVSTLAGKIHAVPAGVDGLILLILIVFVSWYFAFRK